MNKDLILFCRETNEFAIFERGEFTGNWRAPERFHQVCQNSPDGNWFFTNFDQVCSRFRDRGTALRGRGAPAAEADRSYDSKTRFLIACRRLGYQGSAGVPSDACSASTLSRRRLAQAAAA